MTKAVILFSGGLDSTTCLAIAKSEGFDCHTISFNYGQKHHAELLSAERIAKQFGATHRVIDIPLASIGGSALTDNSIDVPDYDNMANIPITYVPARNTIFLSFALAWAEALKAYDIFIGVSAIDYSGYPDCRPEYIKSFQTMANLATKISQNNQIRIHTPLIFLSKAETIHLGLILGVDYQMTVSCYRANQHGQACGLCDSCVLRKKGFHEANLVDPTPYF